MSTTSRPDAAQIVQTERLLSIGAGAVLALAAVRRAPWALALAGLGGALIYRGATGGWPGMPAPRPQVPSPAPGEPQDTQIDATIEESFPASDPPGWHTGSSFTQVSE